MEKQTFLDKLKNSAETLLLVMLLIALLLLIIFYFSFGIGYEFYGALVSWIIFIWLYLKVTIKLGCLINGLIYLLFVSLTIGLMVSAGNGGSTSKSDKQRQLVDCTSLASDQVQKVAGWNAHLFAADWSGEYTPGPDEKTAQKASYKLADLGVKKMANIFLYVEKEDRTYLPTDTKRILEVCDANNKTYQYGTTKDTSTTGATDGVVASETYIFARDVNEKLVPGDFRVDAYLFTGGKWTLVNRIDKVRIEN